MHRLSVRLDLGKLLVDPAEVRASSGLGTARPGGAKGAKGKHQAASSSISVSSPAIRGGPTALLARDDAQAYLEECAASGPLQQYAEAAVIIAAGGDTLREQGAGAAAAIWFAVAEEEELSGSTDLSIARMYDRLQRRVGALRADRSVDADKKTLAIGWMLLMTSLATVAKGLGVDGRTSQRDRPKTLGIEDDPIHLQAPTSKAILLSRVIRGVLRFASQHQTLYTMAFEALAAWLSPAVTSLSVVRSTFSSIPELEQILSVPPAAISPDALAFLMTMEAAWGSKFFGEETVNLLKCGWIIRDAKKGESAGPQLASAENVQLMSSVIARAAASHAPELHPAWQLLLSRRDVALYSRLMRSVVMGLLAQGSDGQRAAALVLWGTMIALVCGVEVEGVAATSDDNTFAHLDEQEAFGLALVLFNRYVCALLLESATAKASPLHELAKRTLSLYVRVVAAPATPTHIRTALIAAVCAHGRRLDLLVKGGLTQTLTAAAVHLDDGIVLLTHLRHIIAGGSAYLSECYGKKIFKKGSSEEEWDAKLRDWCLTQVTTIGKVLAVAGNLDGAAKAVALLTATAFYPDQSLPAELAGAAADDGGLPKSLARAPQMEQMFGRALLWATADGAVAPDAPEAARLSAARRAFQLVRDIDRHSDVSLVDVYSCYVSSHLAVEEVAGWTPSFLSGSADPATPLALRKKLLSRARKNASKSEEAATAAAAATGAAAAKQARRSRERRALATAMIVTCFTLYLDPDAVDAGAQLLESKDEVINVLLLMVQSPSALVHDGATAAWNAVKSTVDWSDVEALIRFVHAACQTKYSDLVPAVEGDEDEEGESEGESDEDESDEDESEDESDEEEEEEEAAEVGSANEPDDEEEEEEDSDEDEDEDMMDDEAMRRVEGGISAAVALAGGGRREKERSAVAKLAALDHAAMRVVSWISTCVLVQRKSPLWLYASLPLARAAKVVNRRAKRVADSKRKARLASASTALTLQNALFKCLSTVSTVTRPTAARPADQAQAVRVIAQLGALLKPKREREREGEGETEGGADEDGEGEGEGEEDDGDLEIGGLSRGEVSVDLKNVQQGLFVYYARSLVYTVGHVSDQATWLAIPEAPWFPTVRAAFGAFLVAALGTARLVPDSWFAYLYAKVPSLSLSLIPDAFAAAASAKTLFLRTHALVTVAALVEDRSLTSAMPLSLYRENVLSHLPASLDAIAQVGTLSTLRERRVVRSLRRLTRGSFPLDDPELAKRLSLSLSACLAVVDEEKEAEREREREAKGGSKKKRKRGTAGGQGAGKGARLLVRELAGVGEATVSRKRAKKGSAA